MNSRRAKLLVLATIVAWQAHWGQSPDVLFIGRTQVWHPQRFNCISHRMTEQELLNSFFEFVKAINGGSSLWDRLQRWKKTSAKSLGETKNSTFLDVRGNTTEQAYHLLKRFTTVRSEGEGCIVSALMLNDIPNQTVSGTEFEKLMVQVLASNGIGLTTVYAEPGVGKSIGTLLALPAGNLSKTMTLLLSGPFRRKLLEFTSAVDMDLAVDVMCQLFVILDANDIHLNLVLDNSFESAYDGDRLITLAKTAFTTDHHIIVITQTEKMATDIGNLNGIRTRVCDEQQAVAKYRWHEEQAQEFLNLLAEQGQVFDQGRFALALKNSEYPDADGGWIPTHIFAYLKTGSKFKLPSGSSGETRNAPVKSGALKVKSRGTFEILLDLHYTTVILEFRSCVLILLCSFMQTFDLKLCLPIPC